MQSNAYPCLMADLDDQSSIPVFMIAETYDRAVISAGTITAPGSGRLWDGYTAIVLDAPEPYCHTCQHRGDTCTCPGFEETSTN